MDTSTEKFHLFCGNILRAGLGLEEYLSFFIATYYCDNHANWLFRASILDKMTFERKIRAFNDICEEEQIDPVVVSAVNASIKFVKEWRNIVAHSEAFVDNPQNLPQFQKRTKTGITKIESRISQELVDEIENKRVSTVKGITNIYLKLADPNRIKPIRVAE